MHKEVRGFNSASSNYQFRCITNFIILLGNIDSVNDFETEGLECVEKIKTEFDDRWSPHWHVVIGRNFGSFVTHETKKFVFFYLNDKAVMMYKS